MKYKFSYNIEVYRDDESFYHGSSGSSGSYMMSAEELLIEISSLISKTTYSSNAIDELCCECIEDTTEKT